MPVIPSESSSNAGTGTGTGAPRTPNPKASSPTPGKTSTLLTSPKANVAPQGQQAQAQAQGQQQSIRHTRYVPPDFKRRQLLFDSFQKLLEDARYTAESVAHAQAQSQAAQAAQQAAAATATGIQRPTGFIQQQNNIASTGTQHKGTLIYAFGAGYHGQLGLAASRKKCRLEPAIVDFPQPVLQVSCGGFHTAALTDDGSVYTWGDGRSGQLGNLVRKHHMHSVPHLVDYFTQHKIVITQIACGQYHTAAVAATGSVYTWGLGKHGQLGHGVRLDERFPRVIESTVMDARNSANNTNRPIMITRVACGDRHTVAATATGAVWSFGSGEHGQLGHGNGADELRPVRMQTMAEHKIVSMDAGATLTGLISDQGELFLCGFGESVHPKGYSNIVETPRLVTIRGDTSGVKQVAIGQGHVLILTGSGDVYAMGSAGMGQLGHGTTTGSRHPRLVIHGKEIQAIAAGRYHSMAVTAYGVLYTWGCGESGQLGQANLENEAIPRVVDAILPNVVGQISCGEHHSVIITSIGHSSLSQDVVNWSLLEHEEFKMKKQLLETSTQGLTYAQQLQMEVVRKGLLSKLSSTLQRERTANDQFAKLQIRSISNPEVLVESVKRQVPGDATNEPPQAITYEEVTEDGTTAQVMMMMEEKQDINMEQDTHEEESKSTSSTHRDTNSRHSSRMKRVGAGVVLPSLEKKDETTTTTTKDTVSPLRTAGTAEARSNLVSTLKQRLTAEAAAQSEQVDMARLRRSMTSSSSTPSLRTTGHGRPLSSTLGPKGQAQLVQALATTMQQQTQQQAHAMTHQHATKQSSEKESDDKHTHLAPLAEHRTLAKSHSLSALVPHATGPQDFHPLVPRIAFVDKTQQQLTKFRQFVHEHVIPPAIVTRGSEHALVKLKDQYNALKKQRKEQQQLLRDVRANFVEVRPASFELDAARHSSAHITKLNNDLVTLNTRLMEAEENKKNYELYIIRMKEEELTVSNQIDSLRSLTLEYDRFLQKLQAVNRRVSTQKYDVVENQKLFREDIAEFIQFNQNHIAKYNELLEQSQAQIEQREQDWAARQARLESRRRETINKLSSELESLQNQSNETNTTLMSWEQKLTYYTKRFHKITAATGLTDADSMISKWQHNDEMTSSLQSEVEGKKELVATLREEKQKLESELKVYRDEYVPSTWKDVAIKEDRQSEASAKLERETHDTTAYMQKLALVTQGMHALEKLVDQTLQTNDTTMDTIPSIVTIQNVQESTQRVENKLMKLMEIIALDKQRLEAQAEMRKRMTIKQEQPSTLAELTQLARKIREQSRATEEASATTTTAPAAATSTSQATI